MYYLTCLPSLDIIQHKSALTETVKRRDLCNNCGRQNCDTTDLLIVILLGMEFKPRTFPESEAYSSPLAMIHKPKYNVTEKTSGGYRQNILVKSWIRT